MNIDFLSYQCNNKDATVSVKKISESNNITVFKFTFSLHERQTPSPVTLKFSAPLLDIFSQWSPLRNFERSLLPDWGELLPETPSRLAFGLPLHSFISQSGQNRICTALSDVKTPLLLRTGVNDNGFINFEIVLFSMKTAPLIEYSTLIRFDMRDIFYSRAIGETVSWIEKENMLKSPPVYPENAVTPIYSTWYSYHQQLEEEAILSECEQAVKLGMQTVIIDDGWQTENNDGGYAYCGEWHLCKSKIGDMASFTKRLHDIGMKVMLWYSVPYVGKRTELWNTFKGKYLDDPAKEWNCLDPRFPDVREYLINIYETALKIWDIDGFKLDFIDEFRFTQFSDISSSKRDYDSVEDALEKLLHDISFRLKAIKPDILIEFRQRYIGPAVKAYGNMLRVGDCAYDMIRNRMGVIDLRLTSGSTPVHSDMIIWNPKDSCESIAKQLIAVLFSVPQISVRFAELPDTHIKVLKFYLDFWIRYRDVLLNGKLFPYGPETLYSIVEAVKDDTSINVCYNNNIVKLHSPHTVIVNGSGESYIILISDLDTDISYIRTNCRGETIVAKQCRITLGSHKIDLSPSDVLEINRI